MNKDILQKLEDSWDHDYGFFGKLHQGFFDEKLYQEFLESLKLISFEQESVISKNVIRLLWYIPLFMEWQKERINSVISLQEYSIKKTQIENELERILGTP